MKKEDLFEALGEVSSRTVQRNTIKRYRERVLTSYIRWAALAAAVIAVGTGLYVFKIADSTHGVKEEIKGSGSMLIGEKAQYEAEEAAPAAEESAAAEAAADATPAAEEAPAAEMPTTEAVAEAAPYDAESEDMSDKMSQDSVRAEAASAESLQSNSEEAMKEGYYNFGVEVLLPENSNWIEIKSYEADGHNIRIEYRDKIDGSDCVLLGVKDGEPDISKIKLSKNKPGTWDAYSADKKYIPVTTYITEDKNGAVATWEYENYKFALVATSNPSAQNAASTESEVDRNAIWKTAVYIAQHLKPVK